MADPKDKTLAQFIPWYVVSATEVQPVGASTPLPVTGTGGSITTVSAVTSITNPVTTTASITNSFAVNQISVTGSATALFAAAANPTERQIVNLSSSIVYIGGTGVTTTSGHAILGSASFRMTNNSGAVSAIVTAGSAVVTIIGW